MIKCIYFSNTFIIFATLIYCNQITNLQIYYVMNKRFQTVMSMLKPKVKAFGFNKKELKGLAAKIAENLESTEDASDEDVNAEIDEAIEAVLPFLALGQSYANRLVGEAKKNDGDDDDDEDDDNDSKSTKSLKTKKKNEKSDDMPEWAKTLLESNNSLKSELAAIKGEKVTDARKVKLEKLLKDTGTFGVRTLKSFSKMKFDDDDDFEDFFNGVEEDLKALNQERANAGLEKLGAPATGGGSSKNETETKVLSDDEVKALADL